MEVDKEELIQTEEIKQLGAKYSESYKGKDISDKVSLQLMLLRYLHSDSCKLSVIV